MHEAIISASSGTMQLLLQYGAYAHHHRGNDPLNKYWNSLKKISESKLPLYTHLLLAGVTIPQEVNVPGWLATRKDLIDITISGWLAPLVSKTVSFTEARELAKAKYGPFIPSILRALPRLLKWMGVVHKTIKKN